MNNVNVINNAGKDVVVTVNKNKNNVQIVIDLAADKKVQLSELKPGDIFKANDIEYIVLEQFEITTAVLRKDILENTMKFGENNNWKESDIRSFLNCEYLSELNNVFGKENIVLHNIDLLSLDGFDDYGKCTDKVSLITIDQYRRYRKVIGKPLGKLWWLLTPDSTPTGCGSGGVQCVGSNGRVYYYWYNGCDGVRPFFLLKSSIFVSCE